MGEPDPFITPRNRRMAELAAGYAMERMRYRFGTMSRVARGLGVPPQNVEAWKVVPMKHVFLVSVILDTPPESLRPDFFLDDPVRWVGAKKWSRAPRDKPIGDHHRAIWFDLETYPTRQSAANRIGRLLNRRVTVRALTFKFGPSGRTFTGTNHHHMKGKTD